VKLSSAERAVCCKLHDDHSPSMRINIQKALWRCDPCGKGGDAFTLYAELHGLNVRTDFSAIVEALTASLGLASTVPPIVLNGRAQNGTSHHQNGNGQQLTLEQFAKAKGFTAEFLSQHGVHEDKNVLVFRYLTKDGKKATRQRLRLSLVGEQKFRWNKAEGRPVPYGLWLLDEAHKRGVRELVLCEGESDWLTFRRHNIAALGIPGADMLSILADPHIHGFSTIYICEEPDQGGETFEKGCVGRLAELEFDGKVSVIEMAKAAVKDPNELHLKFLADARDFRSEWEALTLQARSIELPTVGLELFVASEIQQTKIEWLWPKRVPLGKLVLFVGYPGLGKSFVALDVAARLSSGAGWPDGSANGYHANSFVFSAEDGMADTIVPRLAALGAEHGRIMIGKRFREVNQSGEITRRGFSLSHDLPSLEKKLDRYPGTKLVIVDPVSAYMARIDTHKNAEVRSEVLDPLARRRRERIGEGFRFDSVSGSSPGGMGLLARSRRSGKAIDALRQKQRRARSLGPRVSNRRGRGRHGDDSVAARKYR
jgi:AAA domain/CHC2 zinc finger